MKTIPLFGCLLAAACSAPPPPAPDPVAGLVDRQILEAAGAVQSAQLALLRAGALGRNPTPARNGEPEGAQRLTLTWRGDAYLLLHTLASQRGWHFEALGVKLPLPVVIDVEDVPLETVLEQLRSQTGYRADIELKGALLRIQYHRPKA